MVVVLPALEFMYNLKSLSFSFFFFLVLFLNSDQDRLASSRLIKANCFTMSFSTRQAPYIVTVCEQ